MNSSHRMHFLSGALAALLILAGLPGQVMAQQNSAPSSSAVPQIIQFSGTLGGSATVPSGTVSITFTLYENEQGGTALWSETQNVQVDAQGHYAALLGSASPDGLPLNLFTTGQAHWLSIHPLLPGFAEPPRVLLVSAPYALKARDAETIGGLPPSAFLRSNASSGSSGAASIITAAGTAAPSGSAAAGSATAPPTDTNENVTTGYQINGFYVLTTPGSTTVPNVAVGADALSHVSTGNANTATGFAALFNNTTGSSNTSTGWGSMNFNTSGVVNEAFGVDALYNNTSGGYNVALGAAALYTNSTGNYNVAVGHRALSGNTVGSYNTGVGRWALYSNTTGNYNMAIGGYTLYSNTTGSANNATGYGALYNNTTANYNSAVGNNALYSNTTGAQNTANGVLALFANSTGSNNVAVGYNAASGVAGGNSNNIHIGSVGSSGDSATIRIGNVGTQTSFFAAGISGAGVSGVGVVVSSSGQLGVALSSRRFKEDIHDMGDASDGLMRLRPVTFRYKQPADDGSKPVQYGLIAEEVAEVYPDLVAHSVDGQIETVKYQLLDPMLLNEVQRQNALILKQRSELDAQQAQIKELASQMKLIEASLRSSHKTGRATLASAQTQPASSLAGNGQGSASPARTSK
jgi:trimeric autotransporter adhesin